MKTYKALVRYLDRKANTIRTVWVSVDAPSIHEAWAHAKASFTTLDVIEETR